MRAKSLALIVLVAAYGCQQAASSGKSIAQLPQVSAKFKSPEVDPWVLSCIDPHVEEPALLWNGLMGIRLGRGASSSGAGGAALPLFLIDGYEKSGEEKLLSLPNPVQIVADDASNEFALLGGGVAGASSYRQDLDMRTGVLLTSWKQQIAGGECLVRCETILHPTERLLVQRWRLTPSRDADLSIGVKTAGTERVKQWSGLDRTFLNTNLDGAPVRWALRWRQVSRAEPYQVFTKKGQDFISEFTWRFGRYGGSTAETKLEVVPTFDEVRKIALSYWKRKWETDIEIDGPVEDQQAIRSFLFYLRSAIDPQGGMSVSPMGLSSSQYSGHVFWDADIWVFPALALVEPESASAIPSYRLSRLPTATSNFRDWIGEGRPTAQGSLGSLPPGLDLKTGAKFPWESSVTGKETVPGPSRFQDHITFSVAWSVDLAAALALVPLERSAHLRKLATTFASLRSSGTPREIRGTMSPDESHTGDNDLYTNLLAEYVSNGGRWKMGSSFKLPRDSESFLTYDNDALRSYKQAAAVLAIYPLQYPPAERESRVMMDRFSERVTKNGPAMSDSVHALIWARLGESERAYRTWKGSWEEFVKQPHLQFSEKRHRAIGYFTTGAAGCLQTVIYGFLGFRIDWSKQEGAGWSVPLALDRVLSVKPNLPQSWRSVKFKNFTVLGRRYTLTATHQGMRVIQGER